MRTCGELEPGALEDLLDSFGLELRWIGKGRPIPGSHWGEPEAGLLGAAVLVRADTPVHSALHEASHSICMGAERRARLDTDAGGDDLEECAVCYLQVLLADELPNVGAECAMRDMDAWGYSFRLGSTREWWRHDAAEAQSWLVERGIVDAGGRLLRPVRASGAPMFDRSGDSGRRDGRREGAPSPTGSGSEVRAASTP